MIKNNLKIQFAYEIFMTLLALISVILVFCSFSSLISLENEPYKTIEVILFAIFWADYITRLFLSEKKSEFFKENFFDFLAILPLSKTFSIFRLIRIIKLVKLAKLFKITRLDKIFDAIIKLNKNINSFLRTNGFVYLLYIVIFLIISSAFLMSYAEKISFSDALWWSIVTATTVGYGDIVPLTSFGRFIAIFLMIFGIGFLGILTSTITTFVGVLAKEKSSQLLLNKKESTNLELFKIINEFNETEKENLLSYAREIKKNQTNT